MPINTGIANIFKNVSVGDSLPFSISQTHPLYNKNYKTWEKMNDAFGGQDEIKSKATRYLPQLNGQTKEEYNNYKNRAMWYDATKYTIKSFLGMLYRKAPQVFFDDSISFEDKPNNSYFDTITDEGESLAEFSQEVAEEILKTNRCGILVDFPMMNNVGNILELTKYDYEERGIKPLMSMYDALSIINWYWEYVDYKLVPKYFILKETVDDGFLDNSVVTSTADIYRVLFLESYGDSYRYKQIVFKERTGKRNQIFSDVVDVITPMMNGEYLNFIPFYIIDDKGINYKTIEKPMLEGLADINIGYYKNSADWENFLHILGSPTLVFPGWEKKQYGDPRIGGALAVPKDCKPEMVQASSDQSLRTEMDKKITQMAVLGAQKLNGESNYIANIDTARVSNTSESSNLTIMAKAMGRSFTSIIKFLLKWGRYESDSVTVEFNRDFFDDSIKGDELINWVKIWQQGGMSDETFYYNMKKRELYRDGWSLEEELEGIRKALDNQFNLADEKYVDILQKFEKLEEKVAVTITTSSSGQTLISASSEGGGSNVSTSTEISEDSMGNAIARNNEVRGASSASADNDSKETINSGTGKQDPDKKPNNDSRQVK